ncbi:bll4506 [Bradyrhizobium diazoefficiens USDA 110]|uniref:Bll4506 protein n=1 Tax=Bradyrhizobium diazoefficiens (strain JCM 10833 / BCRC 13528 / IAM 13628 / NBRC 14792 / USDA 110) TaxID=224911 RepID=Q89LN7_BRADU|nr:hypothetical protein CO678_26925 [Bradyrhizobium diazoefficiens]QBP23273.1 hypothetical protein Bdiaspc4_23490 [Bradyrhizobium diazoefficiens]BAC49771.1 bll4506 [Bradyrhizobium diazoefficiens USDA 110]
MGPCSAGVNGPLWSTVLRIYRLAMNFAAVLIDDDDPEIWMSSRPLRANVFRQALAVGNGGAVASKLQTRLVPSRNAILHVEIVSAHHNPLASTCPGVPGPLIGEESKHGPPSPG